MKRCALYVRVSTAEQRDHGLSVDSQIDALQEYCHSQGYEVAEIYNDAGFSARKSYKKRPAMQRMITDCQAGKIDLIIMTKLDRFFRSVKDYYEVMSQIGDIPWRTIWEDYETETSAGVFKVNIMLSVAQSEADRTSERIKSVFEYKRTQGDYVGTPPFGYKRVNKKLVKDDETAPLVELMFKTYLTTFSSLKTIEALSEAGYDLNMNALRKRLKNPVYSGTAQGNECPAYITADEHECILENMKKYVKSTKHHYDYIFSGLLFCNCCGNRLGAKSNSNTLASGEKVPCKYYVCDGKTYSTKHRQRITISEKKMEKYLIEQLDALVYTYNVHLQSDARGQNAEKKKLKLEAKLERVGIRFEDGDISLEEYRAKRAQLLSEINELERAMKPQEPIELPTDWLETYLQLDDIHKRAFWRSFIKEIRIPLNKVPIVKIER